MSTHAPSAGAASRASTNFIGENGNPAAATRLAAPETCDTHDVPSRVLTGIKPTGSPHVGNLLGAIRPALRLADEGLEAMYFIADYHALISIHDPGELRKLTHEVA